MLACRKSMSRLCPRKKSKPRSPSIVALGGRVWLKTKNGKLTTPRPYLPVSGRCKESRCAWDDEQSPADILGLCPSNGPAPCRRALPGPHLFGDPRSGSTDPQTSPASLPLSFALPSQTQCNQQGQRKQLDQKKKL